MPLLSWLLGRQYCEYSEYECCAVQQLYYYVLSQVAKKTRLMFVCVCSCVVLVYMCVWFASFVGLDLKLSHSPFDDNIKNTITYKTNTKYMNQISRSRNHNHMHQKDIYTEETLLDQSLFSSHSLVD
jgi:hypothetical protein